MKNNNHHDGLIIRYVSDRNSLTRSDLNILENDTDKKKEAETLQSDLYNLCKTAADLAPEPLNKIVIPENKPFLFTWTRAALAYSMAVLFLIVAYHFSIPGGNGNGIDIEMVYQEMATDERFMTEVNTLVEEVAYSDFYPETATVENGYDFSDEFIEVIVPI